MCSRLYLISINLTAFQVQIATDKRRCVQRHSKVSESEASRVMQSQNFQNDATRDTAVDISPRKNS
jgi:hypothetical protein